MTISGWGELTWGMTVDEVENTDSNRYWEVDDCFEGYRQIYRAIEIFGLDFTLTLHFKESEGLYRVSLFDTQYPETYEKELLLEIFNTLKAKYGQGSSIKYEYKEEEQTGYPDIGYTIDQGSLNINHIWHFEETTIEFRGSAMGLTTYPTLPDDKASFTVKVNYTASGSNVSNFDKL